MDAFYAETVSKALKNDRVAQKKLYEALAPMLYSVCLRYVQDKVEAQDLLQDTFVKIFHHLGTYKKEGPLEAWARRIAVNEALSFFRKKKKVEYSLDFSSESNVWQDSGVNAFEQLSNEDLLKMIGKLPDGKKLVFNLYVIEGYSHKEIGELLSISEGTSKSQLSKAKEMLVELIQLQGNGK